MATSRIDPRTLHDEVAGTPLGTAVQNVLALLVTAVGFVMTNGIDAVSLVFIEPALGLAEAGRTLVLAIFQSPAAALAGSWDFALYSVTEGNWAFFGPLTPVAIMGVVVGTLSVYLLWSDRYDIDVPTAGDIPFVGLDDSGASEED